MGRKLFRKGSLGRVKGRWSGRPKRTGWNTKGGGGFSDGKRADQLGATRPDGKGSLGEYGGGGGVGGIKRLCT